MKERKIERKREKRRKKENHLIFTLLYLAYWLTLKIYYSKQDRERERERERERKCRVSHGRSPCGQQRQQEHN